MNDLSYKSTGALIDEYLTSELKISANPSHENITRNRELKALLDVRIGPSWGNITSLVYDLKLQLSLCWNAQEVIMSYKNKKFHDLSDLDKHSLCNAALLAQSTNALRCKLVREIDKILGESDRTYLEKTYA